MIGRLVHGVGIARQQGRKNSYLSTYSVQTLSSVRSTKLIPNNVETHFALLKRTAKKDRVEIFRVSSGSKKKLKMLLNFFIKQSIISLKGLASRIGCTVISPIHANCLIQNIAHKELICQIKLKFLQ